MNVQTVLIFVNTTVIALMEIMSVNGKHVASCPMDSIALIFMYVILTMVIVIKSVLIK